MAEVVLLLPAHSYLMNSTTKALIERAIAKNIDTDPEYSLKTTGIHVGPKNDDPMNHSKENQDVFAL